MATPSKKNKWQLELDPAYVEPAIKQVSSKKILQDFGLSGALNKLDRALKPFGLRVVKEQLEEDITDFVEEEKTWARDVHYWWWSTSPYETTNLRHAITINDKHFPKSIGVEIDRTILLAYAGTKLRGWRTGQSQVIPNRKYLGEAEKHNVSARRSPSAPREPIRDFTKSVWEEYAKKRRKELFR